MKKIALAVAVLGLSAAPAFAQSTSTANGSAVAQVIGPLNLTHVTSAALNFGSFTAGAGGTVVVDTTGAGSVTGGVTLMTASVETADSFNVSGQAGRVFTIAVAPGTITSAGNSMGFVPAAAAATGTLDVNGAATFAVGGTLTVANNQAPGQYTGTYGATVTYQ